ncbi:hypothetical protein [Rhodococcus sp. NPDC049939]|uniref:hypothetical protein n=1 Tax=Rhodococcus sp. NPDC049939 TaxID=3155511 RepID=UPI0033CAA1CC
MRVTRIGITAVAAVALLAGGVATANSAPGSFGSGSPDEPTIPGNGTFPVGDGPNEVKPGIYQNPGVENEMCDWARGSGEITVAWGSADPQDPPDNSVPSAVIIEPTDTRFVTGHAEGDSCAEWTWVAPLPHSTGSTGSTALLGSLGSLGKPTIPADGTFEVGNGPGEVKPGIYYNRGVEGSACAWKRDTADGGHADSNTYSSSGDPVASAVIIESTDVQFETSADGTQCAEWKWVAPLDHSTGSSGAIGLPEIFES